VSQVVVQEDGDSYQYEDITVLENSAVNRDMVFSENRSHLYVLTNNKVITGIDNSPAVYIILVIPTPN